jgi:hypothetical protein
VYFSLANDNTASTIAREVNIAIRRMHDSPTWAPTHIKLRITNDELKLKTQAYYLCYTRHRK